MFFRQTKVDDEKDGKCQVGSQWSRWKFLKLSQPPSHPPISYPCPEPWEGNSPSNFSGDKWQPRHLSTHQGGGRHTITHTISMLIRAYENKHCALHGRMVKWNIQKLFSPIGPTYWWFNHFPACIIWSAAPLFLQTAEGLPCWRRRVKHMLHMHCAVLILCRPARLTPCYRIDCVHCMPICRSHTVYVLQLVSESYTCLIVRIHW